MGVAGQRRFPGRQTLLNFRVGELDPQRALGDIEVDGVAIANGGDRPAHGGLGSDVTSHETVRGAGEPSVGEKSHGISETRAHERGRNGEHFAHARATAWTFVADDHDIASSNLILLDGGKRGFFAIEDARGAAEILDVVAGDFDDTALGREIAFEND